MKHLFRSFLDGQFFPGFQRIRDRSLRHDNPLLSLFLDGQTIAETGATTLNWADYGIRSPYVIFITGRCGSTLLTRLIRDTRLAGNPTEHFNINWLKQSSPTTFAAYLDRIIRQSSSNGFFGFEIDWFNLRFLDHFLDFTSTFSVETAKFFYMTRRDILAQALSYASAKATGIWQIYSDTTDSNVSRVSRPRAQALDDQAVWHEIMLILEAELKLEQFFQRNRLKPIRIDYEMLITSKRDVLGLVLLNIGCDIEAIAAKTDEIVDKTLKIPRDQFVLSLTFRERYADLLSCVERVRGSNYDAIQSQLRKQGIDWGKLNS